MAVINDFYRDCDIMADKNALITVKMTLAVKGLTTKGLRGTAGVKVEKWNFRLIHSLPPYMPHLGGGGWRLQEEWDILFHFLLSPRGR